MEEKKNNKGFIWVIVILIVLILGIITFIIFNTKKLDNAENSNNNNNNNNTTTKKNNVITSKELKCDSKDRCVIKKTGNLKISIEQIVYNEYEQDYLLYINDKAIDNKEKLNGTSLNSIIILDDDYIFVRYDDISGEGVALYYIYDSNAREVYDMRDITLVKNVVFQNISYENNIFTINSTNYLGDYAFTVCKYNEKDIVGSEEKFIYLGKGKLSERETLSIETSDGVIHERYSMSCEEIKNSTSKELEYAREHIKEYQNDFSNNSENNKFETKDIVLDFQKEKLNNIMNVGYDVLEPLTENKYKVNLTINNIEVNGKSHYIKIKNYEPYDYDCEERVDKVISFDDNVIYEPYSEGCYLSGLSKILLFKNQYIIVEISSQNGGWINIFDENGIEIKSQKDMVISSIKDVTNDSVIFNGWDEANEEEVCKNNIYELKIDNGVASYNLITKGEEEACI